MILFLAEVACNPIHKSIFSFLGLEEPLTPAVMQLPQ